MKNKTYKCDCCKKTFSYSLPYIITTKPNFSSSLGKRTLCSNCAKFIFSTIDMQDENVPVVDAPKQRHEESKDSERYDQLDKYSGDIKCECDEEPFPVTGTADKWGYV